MTRNTNSGGLAAFLQTNLFAIICTGLVAYQSYLLSNADITTRLGAVERQVERTERLLIEQGAFDECVIRHFDAMADGKVREPCPLAVPREAMPR
jgi:hypothetical protein